MTIHWVDATLDGGRIIAQRAFEYDGRDRAELEARVHAVEHELYVETLGRLIARAEERADTLPAEAALPGGCTPYRGPSGTARNPGNK